MHPRVLDVLQAVWLATAKRPQLYYVSVASLRLPPNIELNDTAIMLAALSGWITVEVSRRIPPPSRRRGWRC